MAKVQIRLGVFETNSSSTHAVSLFSTKEFEDWKSGKTMYCHASQDFLPTEEALEYNGQKCKEAWMGYWIKDWLENNEEPERELKVSEFNNNIVDILGHFQNLEGFYLTHKDFERSCSDIEYSERKDLQSVAMSIYDYGD